MTRAALVGLIAVVLTGAALRDAVSHIRGTRVPPWVAAVAPANAAVTTRQFDQTLAAAGARGLPAAPCWECRARDVLRRDPLGPGPLRVLALYADQRGDKRRSTQLFVTSARLSRRDPIVQLWLIERAGRQGDVTGMIEHYDQLLSVRPQTGPLLYPRLLGALGDSAVRRQVAGLIRARKPWIKDFLNVGLLEAKEPRRLMELFEEVDRGGPPAADLRQSQAFLISRLADKRDYEAAFRQARRVAGKHAAVLTDLAFTPRTTDADYAPLVWSAGGNQGLAAEAYDNGVMRVEIAPGSSGPAFSRDLLLSAGSYRLRSAGRGVEGLVEPESRWEAACITATATRALATFPLRPGDRGALVAGGPLAVPAGCRAVRLSFLAGASGGQEAAGVELTRIAIDRPPAGPPG